MTGHIGLTRQQYWTKMYNHARSMIVIIRPEWSVRETDLAAVKYANVKTTKMYGPVASEPEWGDRIPTQNVTQCQHGKYACPLCDRPAK